MVKCEMCLDLLDTFGDRYRVRREAPAGTRSDPWSQIIPCQHGHIYPHGGNLLGFASRRRGAVARRVACLPYAEVMQAGDDGLNIVFPLERFTEVAAIVHPKRRRRLSDAQRAAAIKRLQPYQLTSGQDPARAQVKRSSETLGRVLSALDDSGAHLASEEVVGLAAASFG
ncbi:MAG: hypothetical protein ACYC3X_06115 [Pirellulaceae bacterium]